MKQKETLTCSPTKSSAGTVPQTLSPIRQLQTGTSTLPHTPIPHEAGTCSSQTLPAASTSPPIQPGTNSHPQILPGTDSVKRKQKATSSGE